MGQPMNITSRQREILSRLTARNPLTRDSAGQWTDASGETFSPADCQWLLDEGILELTGSGPGYERFGLAEAQAERMAAWRICARNDATR